MDGPAINAAEDFVGAGYPREAAALLIVELDGPETEVDFLINAVSEIVKKAGATSIRASTSEAGEKPVLGGAQIGLSSGGAVSRQIIFVWMVPSRARLCLKC